MSELLLDVIVDNRPVTLPDMLVSPDPGKGGWLLAGFVKTADYQMSISATVDPDPFYTYGISVTNFRPVAQTFSYTFTTPVTGSPYNLAIASLSASTVDDASGNGVTIGLPLNVPAFQTAFTDPGNFDLGVALGGGCTVPANGAFATGECGPYPQATRIFAFTEMTQLRVYLQFTLSPGDGVTFNGGVTLTDPPDETPEPGTGVLTALAVAGAIWVRRRRG
jgi:hypothetical protein